MIIRSKIIFIVIFITCLIGGIALAIYGYRILAQWNVSGMLYFAGGIIIIIFTVIVGIYAFVRLRREWW